MASDEYTRPDPDEDPFACSLCGSHLNELERVRGDDYCESCSREYDPTHQIRRCLECGREGQADHMEAIDVSPPDEYYPTFEYLCRSCAGGESDA